MNQYTYDNAGRLTVIAQQYNKDLPTHAYERYLESGYFSDTAVRTQDYYMNDETYKTVLKRLGMIYKSKDMQNISIKRGRNPTDFENLLQIGHNIRALEDTKQAQTRRQCNLCL